VGPQPLAKLSMLSKFRAFCLKLDLATVLISLTYDSSPTAAPCQASVAESPVALPPVSVESRMPYDTPPAPAIERLPLVSDGTPTMLCPSCGDTMKHSRTIAKLGVRLERLIFVCPSCKGVDNRELRQVA
jgi:hypothetical protein